MCNSEYCNFNWGAIKKVGLYTENGKLVTVKDFLQKHTNIDVRHSRTKVHKLDLYVVNDILVTCGFNVLGDVESVYQARRRFYEDIFNHIFRDELSGRGESIAYDVRFQVALEGNFEFEYKYLEHINDNELEFIEGVVLNIGLVKSKSGLEVPVKLKLGSAKLTSKDIFMDEFEVFLFNGSGYEAYRNDLVQRLKQGILFELDRFDFDEFYERTYGVGFGLKGTQQYNDVLEDYLELERICGGL